jgi:hypothetical protein
MNVNHQWGRITHAERDDNADGEARQLDMPQPFGRPFALHELKHHVTVPKWHRYGGKNLSVNKI